LSGKLGGAGARRIERPDREFAPRQGAPGWPVLDSYGYPAPIDQNGRA